MRILAARVRQPFGRGQFASIADTHAPDGQRGKVVFSHSCTHAPQHSAPLSGHPCLRSKPALPFAPDRRPLRATREKCRVRLQRFVLGAGACLSRKSGVCRSLREGVQPRCIKSICRTLAGCQPSVDAIGRTGGLYSETLREALLTFKTKTVHGDFAVDERGPRSLISSRPAMAGRQKRSWFGPDVVATGKARLPTGPSLPHDESQRDTIPSKSQSCPGLWDDADVGLGRFPTLRVGLFRVLV
jgi:hypothetical protein